MSDSAGQNYLCVCLYSTLQVTQRLTCHSAGASQCHRFIVDPTSPNISLEPTMPNNVPKAGFRKGNPHPPESLAFSQNPLVLNFASLLPKMFQDYHWSLYEGSPGIEQSYKVCKWSCLVSRFLMNKLQGTSVSFSLTNSDRVGQAGNSPCLSKALLPLKRTRIITSAISAS